MILNALSRPVSFAGALAVVCLLGAGTTTKVEAMPLARGFLPESGLDHVTCQTGASFNSQGLTSNWVTNCNGVPQNGTFPNNPTPSGPKAWLTTPKLGVNAAPFGYNPNYAGGGPKLGVNTPYSWGNQGGESGCNPCTAPHTQPSDARLKRDIVPLARLDNGIGLYRFRYRGSDPTIYVGVMAQQVAEIVPSAVIRGPDGFLHVDYDRLGLEFMTFDEWKKRQRATLALSE